MEYDSLENIINGIDNFSIVKDMREICSRYNLESKRLLWIDNIHKQYNTQDILEDINRCRAKTARNKKNIFLSLFTTISYSEQTMQFVKDFASLFLSADSKKKYGIE